MLYETKSEAKAAGHKTFFTGRPCAAGHRAERYTSTGACVVCNKRNTYAARAAKKEAKQ
jgi:hypothetical protein